MPCHAPRTAWRTPAGGVIFGNTPPLNIKTQWLQLPCQQCTACLRAHAREWAFRCKLEMRRHSEAAFTTLTYSDEKLPVTLDKNHLQNWLKRFRFAMRAAGPIRFFASGEYGAQTQRAHFHAILYGASKRHEEIIERTWGLGHTRTYDATDATIAYVAAYTDKKLGDLRAHSHERLDPTTGELYHWQPPFIQMSRRPGIGGLSAPPAPPRSSSATAEELKRAATAARTKHHESWRFYAIDDGHKIKVPRYLHEAWKAQATPEQIADTQRLKTEHAAKHYQNEDRRQAQRLIDNAKHHRAKEARQL